MTTMTEHEYRIEITRQRLIGLDHVTRITREWRRELWPDPTTDPIARQDAHRRFMRELVAQTYWGATTYPGRRQLFGGICGA